MSTRLRTFETRGPVDPNRNYVVPRTEEVADLVYRILDQIQGKEIVSYCIPVIPKPPSVYHRKLITDN